MWIRELILKNFGKFQNKKVVLSEGINLVYGENEAGKSTLYAFLQGMIFGIQRGRGRAALNDTFRKYEPWDQPTYYAGEVRFVCGGRNFCLSRNFDKYSKGAVLFCEDDGEELSLEHGDLEILLAGLKESNYENTVGIAQTKVLVGNELAAEIKNYAANYCMTGDSDINLNAALQYLKERKKELEKEIRESERKKQETRDKVEAESSFVWRELYHLEQEIENETRAQEEEQERMIRLSNQKKKEDVGKGVERWRVHPIAILTMIVLVIVTWSVFDKPWNYLIEVVVILGEFIYIWNAVKGGKKKEKVLQELEEKEHVLKEQMKKSGWHLEKLREDLEEKRIQYQNLKEQLEEIDQTDVETPEQKKLYKALELAGERMQEVAKDMQASVGRRLNQEASKIFSQMTNGRYEKVWIDEELQISLFTEGKKISTNQISRGALEQLHFAIRMAAVQILYEEEYPVILDDTFVFYDEARLEQTLRWLAGSSKQVILFTCQKREEEILQKLGIRYRKILL